ncbi:ORF85 [Ranid herpesvirus 1]|uniref:ORF85 n=1 Tax=Ranid herpesvirus 1 TaxID=85655 RepID=Q9YQY3_9VIRU|nr:ORF85 [Ranid herpesvirus 1]AAD12282.1 ORF85 [Ranid herpesvirus 1]
MWDLDPEPSILPQPLYLQNVFHYALPALPGLISVNERLLRDDNVTYALSARAYLAHNMHQCVHAFWLDADDRGPHLIYVDTVAGDVCMRIRRDVSLSASVGRCTDARCLFELLEEICASWPADVSANRPSANRWGALLAAAQRPSVTSAAQYKAAMNTAIQIARGVTRFMGFETRRLPESVRFEQIQHVTPQRELMVSAIRYTRIETPTELELYLTTLYGHAMVELDITCEADKSKRVSEEQILRPLQNRASWFYERGQRESFRDLYCGGWKQWLGVDQWALCCFL